MSYMRRAVQDLGGVLDAFVMHFKFYKERPPQLVEMEGQIADVKRRLAEWIDAAPCDIWENDGCIYCQTHGQHARATEPDDFCVRRRGVPVPEEKSEPREAPRTLEVNDE